MLKKRRVNSRYSRKKISPSLPAKRKFHTLPNRDGLSLRRLRNHEQTASICEKVWVGHVRADIDDFCCSQNSSVLNLKNRYPPVTNAIYQFFDKDPYPIPARENEWIRPEPVSRRNQWYESMQR